MYFTVTNNAYYLRGKSHFVKTFKFCLNTFCLCEGCRSSPKGDNSGLSNANSASVRSSSDKISGFSSPRSASWVWANSSAASTFFSLISSISCCCWKKNKWTSISIFYSFTLDILFINYEFRIFIENQSNFSLRM